MNKVFIIAEAGVNHNGDIDLAKEMIDIAAEAQVDAVKFQTFITERGISKFAPKAAYQIAATGKNESQFEMIKKYELDKDEHLEIIKHCRRKDVMFLSTPFDFESIELLHKLGIKIFKIPSGEITNLPYLRKIGRLKKKIILSTGMADLKEIKCALAILNKEGTTTDKITILHCNTAYPTPMKDVNLSAMLTVKDAFKVNVGYSDHTIGIEVSIAAVALGATVIEKHFTLDKNMIGPDHRASLDPGELKALVKSIRNIEKALGNGVKKPSLSELKNRPIVRKSIVANRDIQREEVFTEENITVKRPGTGLSPMEWDKILGKTTKRDFKEDELIEL